MGGQVTKVSRGQRQRREDNSFMKLARYIGVFSKPENKKHENENSEDKKDEAIAMTTPVVMTAEKNQENNEEPSHFPASS